MFRVRPGARGPVPDRGRTHLRSGRHGARAAADGVPFSFYPESEWRDDLELGATELYLAVAAGGLPAGLPHTDPDLYLQAAAHWANAYITGPGDAADTLNLYDVSGLAHYDLYRAIDQLPNPPALVVTKQALLADLRKQLDLAAAQAATDPFGFGFPGTHGTRPRTAPGCRSWPASTTRSPEREPTHPRSGGWLSNILGANAWGVLLIVGDGTTFPHCTQHQVANIAGTLDGTPPVLAGAAVEGPNGTLYSGSLTDMRPCPADGVDVFAEFNGGGAKFQDNVESFSTVEPAIDLTATSPLAFAWQARPGPASPPPPPPAETVVTIQFDDGTADQMTALPILQAHGMHATFYVNSGVIGDGTHLTWDDLTTLATAGNEIAGHTLTHANIKKLKTGPARQEVAATE